jgi:hypothetical protein
MKRALSLSCLALAGLLALAPVASAQQWETYQGSAYNIQFDVPATWATTTGDHDGVPVLTSTSAEGTMALVVYVYKDSSVSTEELMDGAVDDLDLTLSGQATEEDINGLHAWVAEATGVIEGDEVGMFIMGATYDEDNYVAYVFTEAAKFRQNADVMNRILNSFRPIRP